MICPILSLGFLANKHSALCIRPTTFTLNNLPKYLKSDCSFWESMNKKCIFVIFMCK